MQLESLFNQIYNSATEAELDTIIATIENHEKVSWHPYGDSESFFGVIENQQASAVPALIEKITNSIDAILMKRCYELGIDPKSDNAPKNIDEAIEKFFPRSGNWDLSGPRGLQAESIQILASGPRKNTSLTIYDDGEGQHPENFKNSIMH
jgi:hypothetical protein